MIYHDLQWGPCSIREAPGRDHVLVGGPNELLHNSSWSNAPALATGLVACGHAVVVRPHVDRVAPHPGSSQSGTADDSRCDPGILSRWAESSRNPGPKA